MISANTKLNRKNIYWSEFKSTVSELDLNIKFVEDDEAYCVYADYINTSFQCLLFKKIVPWAIATNGFSQEQNDADIVDFENNYKDRANISFTEIIPVTTRFEVDYLVLKLAKIQGTADENGDLILTIEIPGTIEKTERYAAGGYAVVDNYAWGDAITEVNIKDKYGILTDTPGAVIKTYHDTDIPEENRGWFFWKCHGTQGECEIEPIGYMGEIRGQLELEVKFKISAGAKIQANIWWGKKE